MCQEDHCIEKYGILLSVHPCSLSWQVLCSHVSEAFRFYSGSDNNFVVINQKDIDPPPLHLQARAGVTNSDLSLHDGSALTFNLDLFWGSILVKRVCHDVPS